MAATLSSIRGPTTHTGNCCPSNLPRAMQQLPLMPRPPNPSMRMPQKQTKTTTTGVNIAVTTSLPLERRWKKTAQSFRQGLPHPPQACRTITTWSSRMHCRDTTSTLKIYGPMMTAASADPSYAGLVCLRTSLLKTSSSLPLSSS